jgi:hypothetical protein
MSSLVTATTNYNGGNVEEAGGFGMGQIMTTA